VRVGQARSPCARSVARALRATSLGQLRSRGRERDLRFRPPGTSAELQASLGLRYERRFRKRPLARTRSFPVAHSQCRATPLRARPSRRETRFKGRRWIAGGTLRVAAA